MFLQCFCKQYSMRKHESSPIHIPIKRRKDTPSFEKDMEKLTICGARAQKGKTSFEKNGKAHRLLSKGTRRGIELRFHRHEPSKENTLSPNHQNKVLKKVWPSPHLALVCISLPIDSTVRLILGIARLIFWYSSSQRGRHLPALCTMTPLLMVRWWISIVGIPKKMIHDISPFLPGYSMDSIHYYRETFHGWVEDCVPILMENFALNTLPQSVASWKKADLLDCSPIFNWVELYELFWTWTEWTSRAKKKSKPFSCLP